MKTPEHSLDLAAELRALRASPRAAFADELDARVAAGFPPRSPSRGPAWSRLGARLRAAAPRRLALPAVAATLTALVVATAVIAIDQEGNTASPSHDVVSTGKSASGGHSGVQYSDRQSSAGAAAALSGANAALSGAEVQSMSESAPASGPAAVSGLNATYALRRDVERDAELVLRSRPGEIEGDAKKVFAAVHAVDGIVLSSSIHDLGGARGDSHAGEANARFKLLVPAAQLSDTLASLSRIADVRSRHESTLDITAPTVRADERLHDAQARIDGLLAQLAGAESDGERAAVEAELRAERRQAAALRSRLDRLDRRADFARVSLQIESGEAAGAAAGRWGVGDALDDAGQILATAAGVVVIGLATLGPLALIALLAWLANRAWVRRRRERALG